MTASPNQSGRASAMAPGPCLPLASRATSKPAAAWRSKSKAPPPKKRSMPAPMSDSRKRRLAAAARASGVASFKRVGSTSEPSWEVALSGSSLGLAKASRIARVKGSPVRSRQSVSKRVEYSERRKRAISEVPPGCRQSITTSRPWTARMWVRKARANSVWIDSTCGVMMTSLSAFSETFTSRGRKTKGATRTAASKARTMARRASIFRPEAGGRNTRSG